MDQNFNDVYDEIDNPKTMKEKVKTIRNYIISPYPSKYTDCFCFWFIIPIFIVIVCVIGGVAEQWVFPSPKPASTSFENFSEERAFSYLNYMSLTIGTKNNIETTTWLKSELGNITNTFNNTNIRVEIVSQTFDSIYAQNAENIMVRLSNIATDPETDSVLVSGHYDSAPFSPGAGDNAVNVAAMMELLKNLLSKNQAPLNPIIFLFNNGEEMGLLGVRAFMQNTTFWGKNLKRVINLDSMGGPGKEILFRTNPSSIVGEYSVVPHPHASVIGEEIIGYLPSYTDFSVFKQYNIPGLDLALYSYGYNYHTLGDLPSTISKGGIQHIGDNVLALLNYYGYNKFSNLSTAEFIYFDVFGLFLIRIPEVLMLIIQYILILLLFVTPILYLLTEKLLFEYIYHKDENQIQKPDHQPRPSKLSLVFESIGIFLLYSVGYYLSFGLAIGISGFYGFLTSLVNPMSWFSSITFAIFLYAFPAIFGLVLGQYITFKLSWLFCYHRIKNNITTSYQKERNLSMFYVILVPLAFITFQKVKSGYIFVISSIIFYIVVLTFLLIDLFNTFLIMRSDYYEDGEPETYNLVEIEDNEVHQDQLERQKQNLWKPENPRRGRACLAFVTEHIWSFVPFFSIIPGILFLDIFFKLLSMLLPTSGRLAMNTDVIVSLLVSVAVCFLFYYILPVTHRAANYAKILVILLGIMILIFFIHYFISPYTAKSQKRYIFAHQISENYNVDQNGNLVLNFAQNSSIVNSLDNVPCNYAIQKFKGIQNISCEFYQCTFDTFFNISSPQIQLTKQMNGQFSIYMINITYESSMRTQISLNGTYQMIQINGNPFNQLNNQTWAKYGIESSNWNLIVNISSPTTLNFQSYYLDLKYVPYLIETISSIDYITIMGRPNFFTLSTIITLN